MKLNYEFGDDYEDIQYTYEVDDNEALNRCIEYILKEDYAGEALTDEKKDEAIKAIIERIEEKDLASDVLDWYEDELWEYYRKDAYDEWRDK